LAEKVHEFLDWASKLFDISVCSLGDQQYVDMVCQILNSEAPIIRSGVAYSARGEYLFLSQNSQQTQIRKPPKDLNSLYAFYDIRDQNTPRIEPIILDDNATMWPSDQQDNIIVNSFFSSDDYRLYVKWQGRQSGTFRFFRSSSRSLVIYMRATLEKWMGGWLQILL
jgi:NLI interacting factor-like phosphatase